MIQKETVLDVADNSGAKKVMCIGVLKGTHHYIAKVGDVVVVSVKEAIPHSKVKKGDKYRALIIRTKTGVRRQDGSSMKFGTNSAILLNKQNEPIGTRVFGPVPRELRICGFLKIISLAEEVL